MNTTKNVLLAAGALALVVLLGVGLYLGGFWINRDSTRRTDKIKRDSYERQQTLTSESLAKLTDIRQMDVQLSNPALTPEQHGAVASQRAATTTATCRLIAQIHIGLEPSLETFRSTDC